MKRQYRLQIAGVIILASAFLFPILAFSQTRTVTINKGVRFQKIDGFGAYGLNRTAWDNPPYYNSNFVRDMVDDLGMTISRAESYPMEDVNDNNNPRVADMSKFTPTEFNKAYWQFAKEAQALANSRGDTIKFFYSVWSPPAWMKYVNSTLGGDPIWNRLIARDFTPPDWQTFVLSNKPAADPDDRKDEFVEHCWVSAQMFRQNAGFDLYAYSLQNELAFAQQSFNSCVYSPNQYRELLKVAGKRFRDEGSKIKFMMHEDIGDLGRFRQFMDAVTRDPEALKYQDIGACHAYNASGTLAGSTSATTWDGMFRVVNSRKPTPFWQTETSGYGPGWDGGMGLAKAIYVGLKFGRVSAWVWWQAGERIQDRTESNYAIISDDVKTKRYYTMKHFARYIRPEAVSISSTCTEDADILPLAFQHDTKKTLTVVLINQSSTNKTFRLNLTDPSVNPVNYKLYLTNASNDCVDRGTVAANSNIDLPANSLITLVGQGSEPAAIISSSDDTQEETTSFSVYPNPATDFVRVSYNNNTNAVIEIKDAYSKTVKIVPVDSKPVNIEAEFSTSDLQNGIYFVNIGNQSRKLVIAR